MPYAPRPCPTPPALPKALGSYRTPRGHNQRPGPLQNALDLYGTTFALTERPGPLANAIALTECPGSLR
jgi:hypothetical protein